MKNLFFVFLCALLLSGCQKKNDAKTVTAAVAAVSKCPTCNYPDSVWSNAAGGPMLVFKFKLDSMQARLTSSGSTATVGTGNAAQSPRFNGLMAHYIEMTKTDTTQVGQGLVLYKAEETSCGGDAAISFCKLTLSKDGDVFFSIPLSKVAAGAYKWLRVSLAYQNFDVKIKTNSTGTIDGTIGSFLGSNTYVAKYKMKGAVMTPTLGNGPGNKSQGYWGFYANVFDIAVKTEGQTEQTTVVNPNAASPNPARSGLITGQFFKSSSGSTQPLVITGTETQDVIITVSLSGNKSFEWHELNVDGLFQPDIGETIVDMGLRGMIPKF